MFDLFAYWSTVTLICSPSFVFLFMVGLSFADLATTYATRGRFSMEYTKLVHFLNKNEKLFVRMSILGFVFTCMVFPLVAIGKNLTLVEVVSGIATCLAPYLGWLAPSLISVIAAAYLSRKVCDSYYKVKDLLDKVE